MSSPMTDEDLMASVTDDELVELKARRARLTADREMLMRKLERLDDSLDETDIALREWCANLRAELEAERRENVKGQLAAACPRCGGWTSSGGMSQHAAGPEGCDCYRLEAARG